ncbi:hypothetical protein STEG23_012341, partial [Scotinomys teguina]
SRTSAHEMMVLTFTVDLPISVSLPGNVLIKCPETRMPFIEYTISGNQFMNSPSYQTLLVLQISLSAELHICMLNQPYIPSTKNKIAM